MSKITQLNEKAWSVTIPPEGNINNAYLWGSYNQWWAKYTEMTRPGQFVTREIKLPEGDWRIEGIGERLTEDQWKEIVESQVYNAPPVPKDDFRKDRQTAYRDYSSDRETRYSKFPLLLTATESGLSLLKSKGLQDKSVIILIKH